MPCSGTNIAPDLLSIVYKYVEEKSLKSGEMRNGEVEDAMWLNNDWKNEVYVLEKYANTWNQFFRYTGWTLTYVEWTSELNYVGQKSHWFSITWHPSGALYPTPQGSETSQITWRIEREKFLEVYIIVPLTTERASESVQSLRNVDP